MSKELLLAILLVILGIWTGVLSKRVEYMTERAALYEKYYNEARDMAGDYGVRLGQCEANLYEFEHPSKYDWSTINNKE